jgi:hypothetical protein
MKTSTATGCLEYVATKLFPITISVFSLLLSSVSLYLNVLRSPDLDFVVAPYVSHVVDNSSSNESFFIPVTVLNRGARPGSVLAFDLLITHLPTQKQTSYSAQYYAKPEEQRIIGEFFSPLSLQGYSTDSKTVCFYPVGTRRGQFLSETGEYEFQVRALAANVRNRSQADVVQTFRVTVTDEMAVIMQSTPDGEYPFPLPIESEQ